MYLFLAEVNLYVDYSRQPRLKCKTVKKAPIQQCPGSAADFRDVVEDHKQELYDILLNEKEHM